MKSNVISQIFLFLSFLLFSACADDVKVLWSLVNQSGESIYITGGVTEVGISEWKQSSMIEVKPDSIYSSWVYEDDLERHSLVLYIFRKSIIELYGWEVIKEEGLYDRRVNCSYSQLKNEGYLIVFK